MAPTGLAMPLPAMSGAEPCTGSKYDERPGWMFPEAALPIPPWIIAPRSVRMSPNRFDVTMTSNISGLLTMNMLAASTYR